jgi:alkaline phosphatase D
VSRLGRAASSPAFAPTRRALLAGFAGALVPAATATSVLAQTGAAPPQAASVAFDVAPKVPWLPLDTAATLTRIGFGSCLDQKHPQPIWKSILSAAPELFIMLGDNVYGDVKSEAMLELIEAYRRQGEHAEFATARAAFPFLATWDDHDYGLNDAGGAFPHRDKAAQLFRSFWGRDIRQPDGGIYDSVTIGPEGRRVQVILLDTRSFRSDLRRKGEDFPYWGRYAPDPAPGKTMLGDRQWRWLEGELRKPADIRLLCSSIQVLAEGHGFERWGNLPAERKRLLDLLASTEANGVMIFSGDRHAGAMYALERSPRYPLVELTASSLNRSYGPSKDERIAPLASGIYHPENFGLLVLDWEKGTVAVELHGMDGVIVTSRTMTLAELATKR